MFRITRDPSSRSFIQCLAKITEMVCSALSREALSIQCSKQTHHGAQYAAITPTTSMSTDTIEPLL